MIFMGYLIYDSSGIERTCKWNGKTRNMYVILMVQLIGKRLAWKTLKVMGIIMMDRREVNGTGPRAASGFGIN